MGLHVENSIEMYWSHKQVMPVHIAIYGKIDCNRSQYLTRAFHLSKPESKITFENVVRIGAFSLPSIQIASKFIS
jgi:hypothetical protein